MASIDSRIVAFINENNLDEGIKDSLTDLVQNCFVDYAKHISNDLITVVVSNKSSSSSKTKKDKLENPMDAKSIDDLRKCTSEILNEFCKDNKLKIGGNKKDIMERVWRHIQGKSSDDDLGRAAKPKKEKMKKEIHACSGCKADGTPCKTSGTEEKNGKWFCFRHFDPEESESESESEFEKAESEKAESVKAKSVKAESESEKEEKIVVPEPKKTGAKPSANRFKKK